MHKKTAAAVVLSLFAAEGFLFAGGFAKDIPENQRQDTTSTLKGLTLKEAVVTEQADRRGEQMKLPQNLVVIDRSFLEANLSGSLMQSLESIPGVKAMNIGSGESKPSIRGLGFNRLVVTENGIKHEGQQWGEDHGLEIDQSDLDKVEIIKGPTALLYGSDAIGGVVNLYSNYFPVNPFEGRAEFTARSVNEALGVSAKAGGRKDRFYWKAHFSATDYADVRVPADSIRYYSYYIHLKDGRLRNTAGRERNGSLTLGYAGGRFRNELRVSDVNARSGFFADAHGLEVRLSEIDYDRSRRDVDLPYHGVNHLKVVNHTCLSFGQTHLDGDLSWQHNVRSECSEPVSHGYMPVPPDTEERRFDKHTFTANIGLRTRLRDGHDLSGGVDSEFQRNRRGGWGFILPDFERYALGAYLLDRFRFGSGLTLSGGLRYDWIGTMIHGYTDWFRTPVDGVPQYRQRSEELARRLNSLTWSLGFNDAHGDWLIKAHVGKGFRAPLAKELGTDGVNYHIFRYEKGNASLSPEKSYQLDAGVNWHPGKLELRLDPFVNYFPNYIYLNPTAVYTEGLQTYEYSQSEVFRGGFEAEAKYRVFQRLEAGLSGEYLYAVQLSGDKRGYTLPFSPPWSMQLELTWRFPSDRGFVSVSGRLVGAQREIVPPELPTDGYGLLNMAAGRTFDLKGCRLRVNLSGRNLLNRKYFNHTSYYRLIDVPEPGRDVTLLLGVEF